MTHPANCRSLDRSAMNARSLALASAFCSLGFLVGLPVGIVLLFFDWELGLGVIAMSVLLAPLAKWLDKRKTVAIFGTVHADALHDARWGSGNRRPKEWAQFEAAALREFGPIFELYGTDLDEEDATALASIHRFINEGLGEWTTVVETDRKEYPGFTILIKSYPHMFAATESDDDPALLTVTMDMNRTKVKDWCLNQPSA